MCMTVMDTRVMKITSMTANNASWSPTSDTKSEMSGSVACINNVYMDSNTPPKYLLPNSVSKASCRKAMAKTYVTPTISIQVYMTARRAIHKPLITIIISGTHFRSLTVRPIREILRMRRMRTKVMSPGSGPVPQLVKMKGKSQVSTMSRNTSTKSNLNHKSAHASNLRTKAEKRMDSSKTKNVQKTLSATMKMGSEPCIPPAVRISQSTAIQIACMEMTANVAHSKVVLLAIHWGQPEVW
mmetsp:Transcript_1008/g.3606  ORF Transcript_1008/g.3606 Transcript_1008/m.3606 type:complete len:241 (+) Transcript_1008:655-1377(+)